MSTHAPRPSQPSGSTSSPTVANGGQGEPDEGTGRRRSGLWMTLGVLLLVGVAATLVYSLQAHPIWMVLASAVMFAAASAAAGGLLGLLFGVPRTVGSGSPPGTGSPQATSALPMPGIGANTNLEQISDWLTKIIVGVSLTQLGTIKAGATGLFHAMAPALGGSPQSAAFAGAVVVYFSVVGFFVGWLYARLRLGLAMSNADAWLELARRATRAGDPETARAAKAAAAATVGSVSLVTGPAGVGDDIESLAARYEQLRATMPFGPNRTAQMAGLVREASELARSTPPTLQDVRGTFQIGTEGRRVIALGLMEGDTSLADFPSVLQAITASLSAFEQYHALYVASLMLSSLSADERKELEQALTSQAVRDQMGQDTSRTMLAERILERLTTRPDGGGGTGTTPSAGSGGAAAEGEERQGT